MPIDPSRIVLEGAAFPFGKGLPVYHHAVEVLEERRPGENVLLDREGTAEREHPPDGPHRRFPVRDLLDSFLPHLGDEDPDITAGDRRTVRDADSEVLETLGEVSHGRLLRVVHPGFTEREEGAAERLDFERPRSERVIADPQDILPCLPAADDKTQFRICSEEHPAAKRPVQDRPHLVEERVGIRELPVNLALHGDRGHRFVRHAEGAREDRESSTARLHSNGRGEIAAPCEHLGFGRQRQTAQRERRGLDGLSAPDRDDGIHRGGPPFAGGFYAGEAVRELREAPCRDDEMTAPLDI